MGSSASKNKKPQTIVNPVVKPAESEITQELKSYLSQENKKHVIKCKGCQTSSWWGYLYHCIDCQDLDICTECYEKDLKIAGHDHIHTMIQFRNAASQQFKSMLVGILKGQTKIQQADLKFILHGEINCNDCRCSARQQLTPLVGLRITCQKCTSFNQCLECFISKEQSQTFHNHHKLVLLQASDAVLDPAELNGFEKIPNRINLYKAFFRGRKITIRKFDVESDRAHSTKNKYTHDIRKYTQISSFNFAFFYGSCINIHLQKAFFYQAYEPIEGSILDYLLENPQVSLRRRFQWGMEIINGLEKMHSRGMTHEDLRPQNIFVADSLRAKIGAPGLTDERSDFQAPDFIENPSSPSSFDIYSYGLVLNFIFTGKLHQRENNKIVFTEQSQIWGDLIQSCLDKRINANQIKMQFKEFDDAFWKSFEVETWEKLTIEEKNREFLGYYKSYLKDQQPSQNYFMTPTPKDSSKQFFGSSIIAPITPSTNNATQRDISKSELLQGVLQQIGENIPNPNNQIICKVCGQSILLNLRYKCLACRDYDLCGPCYDQKKSSLNHSNQHLMLLLLYHVSPEYIEKLRQIFISQQIKVQWEFQVSHRGASCSDCNKIQIEGIRIKCLSCNKNLCIDCFKSTSNQHKEHRIFAQAQQYIQTKSIEELTSAAQYVFPEGINFQLKTVSIRSEYKEKFEDELHRQIDTNCSKMIRYVGYSVKQNNDETEIKILLVQLSVDISFANFDLKTQSYRRKFQWMLEMITGIQRIHEAGLAHKAIKPSNVFIGSNYSFYLGPFSFRDELNNSDLYQPPETAYDLLGIESDIFQFGLMINYFFTEKDHQLINEQPYVLEESPIFGSLVRQCVRIDPRERPTSLAILKALQKFDDNFWRSLETKFCSKIAYQRKSTQEKNFIFQKIYDDSEENLLNLRITD